MVGSARSHTAGLELDLGGQRRRLLRKYRLLFLLMAPALATLFIFQYIPIYGVVIAFKDYRYDLGILASPWNDFYHFKLLVDHPFFGRVLRNTIIISVYRIVFGFPAPIIVALLLDQLIDQRFKRTVQSITYLPHFLSWVVVASILVEVISPQRGIVGYIYTLLGQDPPLLLTSKSAFRPILIITDIWKGVGWGSIIYLAAIATIEPSLYEVADMDGANRLQQARRITVPSLIPVITILFILRLGGVLNAGFDQIFNLYNPLVYEVADIIDTYVYRVGVIEQKFGFTTAVGLFKSVVGVILILATNAIIRRFTEFSLW